jgi:osomolarity two-component system response regulator SSK1
MQALIDFDGWRKWKDFANQSESTASTSKLSTSYSPFASRPSKSNLTISPTLAAIAPNGTAGSEAANGTVSTPKLKDEEKKNKRRSMGALIPPALVEEESMTSTAEVGGV